MNLAGVGPVVPGVEAGRPRLHGDDRVILADEPTGNLDSCSSEEIGTILKRLCAERNVTVVLVTHSETVAGWAERRLVMQDGRLSERAA